MTDFVFNAAPAPQTQSIAFDFQPQTFQQQPQTFQQQPQTFQQQPQTFQQQPQTFQQQQQPFQQNAAINAYAANDYGKMDPIDHVLQRPENYTESVEKIVQPMRALDLSDPNGDYRFVMVESECPLAVIHFAKELLANAGDNVPRSREAGIEPGPIHINMNTTTLSVLNGGRVIPIQLHPTENMYVPELIFGNLLTSSNYNDTEQRTTVGRNGIGSKLTNIYSQEFMVRIGDGQTQQEYTQVWNNNMKIKSDPAITQGYTGPNYVEVTYKLDFARFGWTEYPPEVLSIIAAHAADLSFTCKVPVIFNGVELKVQNVTEYSRLAFGDSVANSIVHYEWPPGTATVKRKNVIYAKDPNVLPLVEMCVVDTPDNNLVVAFTNGQANPNGGVHVDIALKAVGDAALNTINDTGGKKGKGKGKGKAKTASKKFTLTMRDVKPHLSIVISCRVFNPKFDGQSKTKLMGPKPKINIEDKVLKPILKWDLIARLNAALEAKYFAHAAKGDGKKSRYLDDDVQSQDANEAGTANSHRCTAYVIEGLSAMGYATKAVSLFDRGRDTMGVFPLKGKPLNVLNVLKVKNPKPQRVIDNKVFRQFKKFLGLREKVNYLDPANFNTLRYGRVVIMADSDVDGMHILGLLICYFEVLFPTLLERGYVSFMRTPILRVWKGSSVFKFYTESQYVQWKEQTPDYQKWNHKYFKGLGTSTDDQVKDDFIATKPVDVRLVRDNLAPDYTNLAFAKTEANARKGWIMNHKPTFGTEGMEIENISSFIHFEMIKYAIANIKRSIPHWLDGQKPGQRKAIYASFKHWGAKVGKPSAKEKKTSRLANYISEETDYHHGEKSLIDTIERMTLNYVGTNNLPIFTQHGQFGTRNMDGKDGADARYTFTKPEWWWRFVFKKDDDSLVPPLIDEGGEIEPAKLLPIIPLALVNGADGIATGWSTNIQQHNPVDICNWLKAKAQGLSKEHFPILVPWYRDFIGTVEVVERVRGKINQAVGELVPESPSQISGNNGDGDGEGNDSGEVTVPNAEKFNAFDNDDSASEDEEIDEDDPLGSDFVNYTPPDRDVTYSVITTGVFTINGGVVTVTELPVGRSMSKYEAWLKKMRKENVITEYKNNSKHDKVFFEIWGFKNPTHKSLRLQRSIGMSNMNLVDDNGTPHRFNSAEEYIESFYNMRLSYYVMRREHMISKFIEDINKKQLKIKFIEAVLKGDGLKEAGQPFEILGETIVIFKRKTAEVYRQMDALGLPHEIFKETNSSQFTIDGIHSLEEEIIKLTQEKNAVEAISAEQLWVTDIDDFLKAYGKHYKCKITSATPANTFSFSSPSSSAVTVPPSTSPISDNNQKQPSPVIEFVMA